jgi:hypothetical protein
LRHLCLDTELICFQSVSEFFSFEAVKLFAAPARKPNAACPVGHCIGQALYRVLAPAQAALERDLE